MLIFGPFLSVFVFNHILLLKRCAQTYVEYEFQVFLTLFRLYFNADNFFLLSFWLKFKVHIMFWVKRLSPRYDYASSFMLFFLFSLLFCFVTMIFWCIFAVFAPSIGILWVVVVVVITSCSWAQSSFLVWYHLSMREKKKFYPLVVRVCVCMCEFVWMYFRRSLFFW